MMNKECYERLASLMDDEYAAESARQRAVNTSSIIQRITAAIHKHEATNALYGTGVVELGCAAWSHLQDVARISDPRGNGSVASMFYGYALRLSEGLPPDAIRVWEMGRDNGDGEYADSV